MFALRFRKSSKCTVNLRNKNLLGTIRTPEKLQLDVSNAIDVTDPIESLRPGTFLILRARHPLCDFVAYSEENCELFFIQISKSTYAQHAKVIGLTKATSGKKSILEYYMDLCITKNGEKRFKNIELGKGNDLPKGVYYLYVTTSISVVTKRSNFYNHPVVLMDRDELCRLGSEWIRYIDRFT